LGLNIKCLAFDVNQGCSGFVYGLAVGASLIESGIVENALLLCGETYTKYIDKNDRTNRPVFSDGAAAALLIKSPFGRLGPFEFGSDGSGAKHLIVESSGARKNDGPLGKHSQCKLFMDGPQVLMFSMREVPRCVTALLEKSGRGIGEIDLFIFHQASKLVIDNVARHLKLSEEKIFRNYQRIGNTVSASIPIALSDAEKEGRLKTGDLVMLVGFGVGYSWGACLMNWVGHV
jgi:3-oxoacyl-[acyl-carrier-protein] synthase III